MDIASLVRIFEPNPNDEFVDKRSRAIGTIKDKLKGKTLPVCLSNAEGIAQAFSQGRFPDALATELETAIKDASSSFIRTDQDLQMLVCGLGAALQLIEELRASERGGPELFVASLLAALAQLGPHSNSKVERLRQHIVVSAREFLEVQANASRARTTVPAFDAAVASDAEAVDAYAGKVKRAADRTINALVTNAALDREELDLLWWSLADWSETLATKISLLPDGAAVMVSALEIVHKLKKLPAVSHAHIATRHIAASEIAFADFKNSLETHKATLQAQLDPTDKSAGYPHVFPLFRALLGSEVPRKTPQKTLHWCRDLTLELFVLLKLSGRMT